MARDDAFRRERFLKTGKGKRFLKNRLSAYLERLAGTSWNGTSRPRQREHARYFLP